jgi:hypothetical protein
LTTANCLKSRMPIRLRVSTTLKMKIGNMNFIEKSLSNSGCDDVATSDKKAHTRMDRSKNSMVYSP